MKIAVIGSPRDPLDAAASAADIFGDSPNVRYMGARSPIRDCASVWLGATRAVRRDGVELIHLLDARLAPLGRLLRHRYGVPVTASVSPADLALRPGTASLTLPSLDHLDGVFADHSGVSDLLIRRVWRVPITSLPSAAYALPAASARAERSVRRALGRIEPERFVLALAAPSDVHEFERFWDEVLSRLPFNSACLVLGPLPGEAAGRVGKRISESCHLRVVRHAMDVNTIAAVARCADAFLAPWSSAPDPGIDTRRGLLMASSGVPLIAALGGPCRRLVEHEINGFVVDPARPEDWVATLDGLFALPPLQRQFLGEEFTRGSLELAPAAALRAAYADRFAAILGGSTLSVALRAA